MYIKTRRDNQLIVEDNWRKYSENVVSHMSENRRMANSYVNVLDSCAAHIEIKSKQIEVTFVKFTFSPHQNRRKPNSGMPLI